MDIIRVEKLRKEYKVPEIREGIKGSLKDLFHRKYNSVTAVNDISFSISKGEIVGYIGPNGAGKTTTVKLLSGILAPSSGHINILGNDPFKHRIKNAFNVGMVMGSQSKLLWNLPVIETFNLFGAIYEVKKDVLKERIKKFSEILGVEHLLYKQARTFSLGERTRCNFLLALIHNPPILFLDEPTIGMDIAVKFRIRDFLKEIRETYGTTIILTSHDIADIEDTATRMMIIDEGKLIFDGSPVKFQQTFSLDEIVVRIKFKSSIKGKNIFSVLNDIKNISLEEEGEFFVSLKIKKEVPIFDVLTKCNRVAEIGNILISEEPISQIVRRIYEKN
ncbi:MAG: ATP-binding cassette domain-containing protein [bacterium]|nr:ATP-binding cassette domain-containing protein [bacterium]